MIYPFKCNVCGTHFDVVQSMNERHTAKHCGVLASRVWSVPNTHKDLMYNFNAEIFGPNPVEIRSRGQFKRLLKQHGLADASLKECRQHADFRKKINAESVIVNRRKNAESIYCKLKHKLKRP